MKARTILASLALLSCAAHAQPLSRIFALTPKTPDSPAIAVSYEPCGAPGNGVARRAFVVASGGGSRVAEACWLASDDASALVAVCQLRVAGDPRSRMTDQCWAVPRSNFKPFTMPRP